MEHIGKVIQPHAEIGLGSKIESLLHRVDKHIDQRIYHENDEKKEGRQKVQPGLFIIAVHMRFSPFLRFQI